MTIIEIKALEDPELVIADGDNTRTLYCRWFEDRVYVDVYGATVELKYAYGLLDLAQKRIEELEKVVNHRKLIDELQCQIDRDSLR